MRPAKARYQLWQIMLAIAVLAGLFAAFGVTLGAAIGIVIGVIALPVLLAPAGCRLRAAAWVCSLYPLLVLSSLYVTWFIAWCVLGHRPRFPFDDPGHISPAVDVLYIATHLLMGGWWFILPPSIPIVLGEIGRRVTAGDDRSAEGSRWDARVPPGVAGNLHHPAIRPLRSVRVVHRLNGGVEMIRLQGLDTSLAAPNIRAPLGSSPRTSKTGNHTD